MLANNEIWAAIPLFKQLYGWCVVGFRNREALDGISCLTSEVFEEVPQLLVGVQIRIAVDAAKTAPESGPFDHLPGEY